MKKSTRKHIEKLESVAWTTCGLHNKRSNEGNYRLTNRRLAASGDYQCQESKRVKNTWIKHFSEVEEHKNKKKMIPFKPMENKGRELNVEDNFKPPNSKIVDFPGFKKHIEERAMKFREHVL